MQIEAVNPEVIGQQDYMQTEIENLFIAADGNSLVVVGIESAYLVKLAE